jgi:DNA polymerase-3 subunit beta
MRFVISTQELNYLVSKCLNVISPKPAMPILSNFLVEVSNGTLTMTATDLKVGVRCYAEVKVLEEGSTTLPAKTFSSLVRELTALNVEIATNENNLTEVLADSSRFKVLGMGPSEYPALPDMTGATKVTIPQNELKETLGLTAFAVSRDEKRPYLMGVCMQIQNGSASFIATDGKRLAKASLAVSIDPSLSGSYIIPGKAVDEFSKILESEGTASLYLMADKIAVETESCLLVTKLLTGEYPDVQQVIPESTEVTVTLHRDELMTLLRQVALFGDNHEHISAKLSFENGELRLDANAKDVGEGKVSMPVNYHNARLDIAFNPVYFLDILKHIKGETFSLGLIDSFNPGVITESEGGAVPVESANPLFVLMPLRLSS